jgi:regulation of enolase protein 1 (concanavalin A-like superfamily)
MGRDQGHSYGQLLNLAFCAEVFWKQGVDVYSDMDNRVLAAGEYYARYNLGIPTPWVPFGTKYNYFHTQGGPPEGPHRPADVFNLIQGAYVVRKGLSAPYVTEYRDKRGENMESFVFRKSVDPSLATPPPPLTPPAGTAAVTMGLLNADIGDAKPGGSATYDSGTWTVKGGGSDIWGGSDSYHFAYREVAGDFTLIAKVASMQDANAKAGLVMRDSLAANAPRRLYIGLNPSANGLVATHLRGYTADSHNKPDEETHRGATIPQWFKIQRIGSRITIFHSADGGSWTPGQNAEYAGWTGKAYAGLAVCSMQNGKATTVTFEEVRITGGDGNEPPKAPAAPAEIYASPGDSRVPLRWLESFGASTYIVKRATAAGGPYIAIAKVNGTSYVDTGAPAGEDCYYVVAASNAAGESADSPETGVKPRSD